MSAPARVQRKRGHAAVPAPLAGQAPAAQEVELKCTVRSADIAALRARLDAYALPRRNPIDNIYYDTPQLHLARARAALRLRAVGAGNRRRWLQTFKTDDGDAALSVRGEWETAAPKGRLDLARFAGSPLERVLRAAPGPQEPARTGALPALKAVFRTQFVRTAWTVRAYGAQIEAALDIGQITAGGRSELIQELELELQAGPASAVVELALDLAGADATHPGARLSLVPYGASKAARGYALANGAAGATQAPERPPLDLQDSVGAVARHLVGAQLTRFLANACSAATSADPRWVHGARVALRRIRAGLELLRAQSQVPEQLRLELRAWARSFGRVRDWDVLCADVLPLLAEQGGKGAAGAWSRINSAAQVRRSAAWARLQAQLDDPQFALFALRALHWSTSPAKAGKPVLDAAAKSLRLAQVRLEKSLQRFARLSAERQHKARILGKTVRYGLEMMPAAAGKKATARRRALMKFQTVAGNARDARLALTLIAGLSRSTALRAQIQVWLAQQEQAVLDEARALGRGLTGKKA